MVFIEMERDENFPENLVKMLDDVENLTNVEKWTFQAPRNEDPIDLSVENLADNITLNQDEIIEEPDESNDTPEDSVPEPKSDDASDLAEFWKFATVDSFLLESNSLTLNRFGNEYRFEISKDIPSDIAIIPDDTDSRAMQSLLGGAYSVFATKQGLIVENGSDHLLIKPLDR
jgi:hypothetical protein